MKTPLSFIDSFQFLSSSLSSLVKKLGKDDFKYLRQEFDNDVLDFRKNCLVKKRFIVPWSREKLITNNVNMFLIFEIKLK